MVKYDIMYINTNQHICQSLASKSMNNQEDIADFVLPAFAFSFSISKKLKWLRAPCHHPKPCAEHTSTACFCSQRQAKNQDGH